MTNNDFSDILNAQGFSSANKQSTTGQTLKQLKNEAETVEMDPVKRAVSLTFYFLSFEKYFQIVYVKLNGVVCCK